MYMCNILYTYILAWQKDKLNENVKIIISKFNYFTN